MTQQPYYQPQYPAAPAQPAYPQQGYPQPAPQPAYAPQAPAYPQQPYAAPQPVQQPLAQGTIDDFYNQPSSGGGPSLKFEQVGTRYIGVVARPLGPGDVQQQTDTMGRALFFKDGRPKFVMKVPLQLVQPHPAYPEGTAQWYVKGAAKDELARAMAAAGCPADVKAPEPGATIDVTFVSTRQSGAGMNPAKVFQVVYTRPNGAQGQAATEAPSPVAVAQPVPQVPQQPVQPAPVQQYAPQAPQPAAQVAPQQGQGLAVPEGLTPEQQALFAQLAGQQAQG